MDWIDRLLPELMAPRFESLGLGPGRVYPHYDGYSLLNLPDSVCRWLGAETLGPGSLDDSLMGAVGGRFRRVIVFLIDGLGLERFRQAVERGDPPAWQALLDRAVFAPLTSISPSTTVAALTTLWTAASPARHGVVGYELWLKEVGILANMIHHSPVSSPNDPGGLRRSGFDPQKFLPVPTLGPHLARHGIRVEAFMHHSIARSGLSEMHFPQVAVFPYRNLGDLFVSLRSRLEQVPDRPTYTYVYWGDLDELAHRYGPDDRRITLEFDLFSRVFQQELLGHGSQAGSGKTLVVVTADHGMAATPRSVEYEIRSQPELIDALQMYPSGETRLAYLFIRPGAAERVEEYFSRRWPDRFEIVSSQRLIDSGLVGPQPNVDLLRQRTGDRVVIAREDAYLWWADKENTLLGRHGGLNAEEMLIPFFAFKL